MSEETPTEGESKATEKIKRAATSGSLSAASGGVTLLRAANALRQRRWKRAGVRLLAAGLWFGVAAYQRRSGSDGAGPGGVDVDQRDVANTSPDLQDVATDADEGTGTESHGDPSEVVDTMSVDIDESDTATELDSDGDPSEVVDTTSVDIDESNTATELDSDVDPSDVEQRDVVETGVDAEDAADAAEAEESGDESAETAEEGGPEEPEEPAHTDNAHIVGETDESAFGGDETDGDESAADEPADADEGDGDGERAEPRSVDDDAEPAITESSGEEGEEDERPAE